MTMVVDEQAESTMQDSSSQAPKGLLFNKYVRIIIGSFLILQLGVWVRNFAILLYVTDITDDNPLYVSLISVAEFAPIFIFSFIGGAFADRWKPKLTMFWCDILSAISVFIILLTLIFGSWHVIFFATLISAILSQFSHPSAMKLFKRHVPAEQLQGVMALFQSLFAVFMVIGPVIGTFIYQRYGIEISILIMGAMFLCSACIIARLPKDEEKFESEANSHILKEMTDGIRYAASNKILRTLGGTFAAAGLAVGLMQPMMIFIAIENLGQQKDFLQWLLMANGAAMLIGGGLVMAVAKKVKPQLLLAAGMLTSCVCTLGIGWSESIPFTIVLQVISGLMFPCIHIGINTLIMNVTDQAFIGRVNGVLTPMFMGMMVIAMSLTGLFKEMTNLLAVFSTSSALFLIGVIVLIPILKTRDDESTAVSQVSNG